VNGVAKRRPSIAQETCKSNFEMEMLQSLFAMAGKHLEQTS